MLLSRKQGRVLRGIFWGIFGGEVFSVLVLFAINNFGEEETRARGYTGKHPSRTVQVAAYPTAPVEFIRVFPLWGS